MTYNVFGGTLNLAESIDPCAATFYIVFYVDLYYM